MIYFDNAATTIMHKEVVDAMRPYWSELYGNPSSLYDFAIKSRESVEKSRKRIADVINAKPEEIYFTSGGTESDNWAIYSAANAINIKGNHIITTVIEHPAVLNTCRSLTKKGYRVSYIPVDKYGVISLEDLENAITDDTVLISVMFANNEIGTIEPIDKIAQIAHKYGIAFHTDAVQAFCQIPIDVKKLKIDMLSLSGHKFNGPKGVGALYIRQGLPIEPFMNGGSQEKKKRAGTTNVPSIVGMGEAAILSDSRLDYKVKTEIELRDYFIKRLSDEIADIRINGDIDNRLPGNVNVSFKNTDGESLLVILDENGICASAGSACSSLKKGNSHVLEAICVPDEFISGSIRFTLSENNTKDEIDFTIKVLKDSVEKLRVN